MPAIPPRDNRSLLAVDALKSDILSGVFKQTLPGERALSTLLKINRKTVIKALEILTDQQWISPPRQGKRRLILKRDHQSPLQLHRTLIDKTVVLIAPHPLLKMSTIERFFQSELARLCKSAGINLRHRHLDARHLKHPAHRLKEFILQNPADIYLLQQSTQAIQQWFVDQAVPALVLGSIWENIQLPSIDGDHAAMAVHLATLLHRNKHQRVAVFETTPIKKGMEVFLQKLTQVAPNLSLIKYKFKETPEHTRATATRLLSNLQCTAVITPTIFSTLSILSTAGQMGVRIPQDLTLISLSHDTSFEYCSPAICGYRLNWPLYAALTFSTLSKLLLHPQATSTTSEKIIPEFHKGESIYPART